MLVIRRRQGESILIGEGIEIEVIDISPGRVKIGIKAPPEVPILRKEIRLVGHQNEAAARTLARALAALLERQPAGGASSPQPAPPSALQRPPGALPPPRRTAMPEIPDASVPMPGRTQL